MERVVALVAIACAGTILVDLMLEQNYLQYIHGKLNANCKIGAQYAYADLQFDLDK